MFSADVCRDLIQRFVKAGDLNGDRAAELERQIITLGLPVAETRYDKISKAFTNNPNYERMIGIFCGALPPEKDSGSARFEPCERGKHCKSEFCAEYPSHVVLVLEGIALHYGSLIFSQEGAKDLIDKAVEQGLLIQEEADVLMPRLVELSASSEAERADKLCQHLSDEILTRELELAFGFRRRDDPPRFDPCRDHYHLRIDDSADLGMRLKNEFDVRLTLDTLMQSGLLSKEEQTKLLDDLAALNLPPGSKEESILNPKNVIHHVIDQLFEVLSHKT